MEGDTFGNFVKLRRKQLGLSLEKVGKATGYTFQAISLFENNINEPSLDSLYNYAQILQCSINDFFIRTEFSDPSSNTPIDLKILTKSIKEIRKANNLRQEDLCEICDISIRSLRNYEKGLSVPSFKFIENFLNYFNIQFTDLLIDKPRRTLDNKKAAILLATCALIFSGVGIGIGYGIFNKPTSSQDSVPPVFKDYIDFSVISNSHTIRINSSVTVMISISPGLDFYDGGNEKVTWGYDETLFEANVQVNEQSDVATFTLLSAEDDIPSVFHIYATYKEEVYTFSDVVYLPTE